MRIGMIGLGRMGMNMTRRLLQGGHEVVAYNRSPGKTREAVADGADGAFSLEELVGKLTPSRTVWLMLPAGAAVDEHLGLLARLLAPGDVVVDGGNTHFKADLRRAESLAGRGIQFMDVGTSGGIWGLQVGYCLMIGGPRAAYESLVPIFRSLAPEDGFLYCGPTGAGHFVKMVHNGIEYGMMQAYAEGFEILEASPYRDQMDFAQVAHLWNRGSVVRSWLLELAEAAFAKDPRLSEILGFVEDSGEGRWTVQQAVDTGVSAPVITLSLMERFRSRKEDTFGNRVLAALRREFGGHAVVSVDKP